MQKPSIFHLLCLTLWGWHGLAHTEAQSIPEADRRAYVEYFQQRFPNLALKDYVDGAYNFDPGAREQWLEIEDFPPYELVVDEGKVLFNTPFANGKRYADCFENQGIGVRGQYPKWDSQRGEVVTLELALNDCRQTNNEPPLPYKTGDIAALSAYMAYTSRGQTIDVKIPTDDAGALAAYEAGKRFYYSRRGQLNMSCANCHNEGANVRLRAELPSPGLGQISHFPVYRAKWQGMGTLHRRYAGCLINIRAKPFSAQSVAFRNLEYFHTYMSNGLLYNGPGSRK